ncbi:hypothetical protein WR25_08599 [Diploscapter pachys]|uniref:XPG-I domain-containing protein n=1 Tax=Diploscapter pachys TaxID=2018661 RepID=A0A2A2KNT7_9BILA|nr:hypothetical protein WR25_08599 [Diploscapter pachys]
MAYYRRQRISELLQIIQEAERQKFEYQENSRIYYMDRSEWYRITNESQLTPLLMSTFKASFLDQDTQNFLDYSNGRADSFMLQYFRNVMTAILSIFLSKTSINGFLGFGNMFLFSEGQIRELLNLPVEWTHKGKRVLDLGAGNGMITKNLGEIYEHIYATEMSTTMQYRLKLQGFTLLDAQKWSSENIKFDLICALNLLDRHFDPKLLLGQIHSTALKSNCPVLMAVVLPVKQYVEFHPTKSSNNPDQKINVYGRTFEQHANTLVQNEFIPAGFELIRWTKLPYLCEGDMKENFYLLYDALFLLKAVPKNDVVYETLKMGIKGLWPILEPSGRPINLETLEGKTLSVDVSLWIGHAKLGHSFNVRCGHVALLLERMCKLLYYKIRPIFVFDGPGVPHFKKRVQKERRLRRHLDELALTQRGKKQLETLLLGGQTQEELEDVARHIIVPRRGVKADLNIFDLPSTSDYIPEDHEDNSDDDVIDVTDETEIQRIERLVDRREKIRESRLRPNQIPQDSSEFSQFQLKRIVQKGVLNAEIERKVKDLTGLQNISRKVDDDIEILEGEQSSSSDSKRLKLTLDLFAHNSSGNQEIKPEVENPESSTEKLSSQEILNKLEEEDSNSEKGEFISKSSVVEMIASKRKSREAEIVTAREDNWSSSSFDDDDLIDVDDEEMMRQIQEKIEKERPNFEKNRFEGEDIEDEEEWDPMRNYPEDRPSTSKMGIDNYENDEDSEVLQRDSKIQKELQDFLSACGFPWVEAPGEAEAQCVELERLELVQGVVSDDSDVFAFGAKSIYRNLFSKKKDSQYFETKAIQKNLGLSRVECIAVAIISGGDYSPGLKSVGMVTALELIAQFAEKRDQEELSLEQVQEKVTTLLTKIKNWLLDENRREPTMELRKLRETIEKDNDKEAIEGLINPDVIHAYVFPNVNSSREKFRWGKVDIEKLKKLLFVNLGWDERKYNNTVADAFIRWNEFISGKASYQRHITSYAYSLDRDEKEMSEQSKRVQDALKRLANRTNSQIAPSTSNTSLICQSRLVDHGTVTRKSGRGQTTKRTAKTKKGRGQKQAKTEAQKALNLSESSSEEEEENPKDANYRP